MKQLAVPVIDFPRHFAWLFGAMTVIVALRLEGETQISFAFYGALHASSIVLALRGPQSTWRALAFVGIAAAVCELNFFLWMAARSLFLTLGTAGPYLLVGAAAGIGSLAYAALVRVFWLPQLQWRAAAWLGILCTAAGLFAILTGRRAPLLGAWWVVALWWLAFSGGLAWADGRATSVAQERSG